MSDYAYTNLDGSAPPPITKVSTRNAVAEGMAARDAGEPSTANPYRGLSMTLDQLWRSGYDQKDAGRRAEVERDLAQLQEQGQAPKLPDDDTGRVLSPGLAASLSATFDVSRMPASLKSYWVRGKGAAIIRWGQPGDFDRCRRAINKEIVEDGRAPLSDRVISGLCSNLHVEATGGRPGTE